VVTPSAEHSEYHDRKPLGRDLPFVFIDGIPVMLDMSTPPE
jgi:hypothetical protein